MTRINTNVSSLQAQINLSRNNEDLQTALTRLSTGLRINSGKDDPAGLIASETLRSDITATKVGISNSERANQMIATADSALGQVSSLLIDVRGLVNEAANSGAMSAEQIAANQLQVDSSLDAIDRISQITQFQGSRLLDGSLAFTTDGVDSTSIDSIQIDQANFGSNPTIGVNVELLSQASKGSLTYTGGQVAEDLVLQVGGTEGFQAFSFDAGTSVSDMASAINLVSDATGVTAAAEGVIEWDASAAVGTVASYGSNNDINITANTDGEAAGAYYVRYSENTGSGTTEATITEAEVDATTGEITYGYIDVKLGMTTDTAAAFTNVIGGIADATNASGSFTFATGYTGGGINWEADGGGAGGDPQGNMPTPTITFAAGGAGGTATVTYDDATQTYAILREGQADLDGDALVALLNGAAGGEYQFTNNALLGNAADATTATAGATTAGTDGIDPTTSPVISAVASTPGTDNTTPITIAFTDSALGGASYDAATNTYTVDIDNTGGTFSLTSAALAGLLDGATGGVHDFTDSGAAGSVLVNALAGDVTLVTDLDPTTDGTSAGDVVATATDVIDAINAEQDAMVDAETIDARLFTVENAAGNDGTGTVAISEVSALTGSDPGQEPDANNMLQFQALDGMRDIRYVASGNNTALSIDLNTYNPEYAKASAIIDLGIANGTFKLESKLDGEEGNQDVAITWATGADDAVSWDGTTLAITVDNDDATTVEDIMDLINSDSATIDVFTASLASAETEPSAIPDVGDASGLITSALVAGTTLPDEASLTGGVVSEGVMVVNLATDANGNVTTTASDLIAFIEASDEQVLKDFQLQVDNGGASDGSGLLAATTTDVKFDPSGTTYADAYASGSTHAANGSAAQFTVTSKTAGTGYDDVLVRVVEDTTLTGTNATSVAYQEDSKTLLVSYKGTITADDVVQAINTDDTVGSLFTAEATAGVGSGSGAVAAGDFVRLSGGETRTVPDGLTATGVAGAPMVQLIGGQDAGEDTSEAMLTFSAGNYGSKSFVSVESISGTFSVTDSTGTVADRSYGEDVAVRINGLRAVGDGLNASLSTSSLQMDLGMSVNMAVGDTTSFSITGGGAQFQLGPDVVSNQQARIGIMSVSSATLGGLNGNGRLFEIRSGESYDLSTDTTGAASIIEDVIGQVTGLRGRLGAFQKTTLETNIASLQDTLETMTAAESSIRDADFAEESSSLTRAQILVQSGTKVLGIANQQPQNVLSLIG